ncbi:MAG: hypothetical protein AAGA99_14305 [Actinomycetota bacterium]
MLRRVAAVAVSQARDLSRRRLALGLLILLPLTFYWSSSGDDFAPVFASVGIGWAFSVATLFLTQGMRPIEPRLALAGFRSGEVLAGRVACAVSFGLIVATALWLYIRLDPVIVSEVELVWAFLFAVIGSVALGLAVGALVKRELEAMLLLVGIIGIQFVVDPGSTLAKVLPLFAAERQAAAAAGWGDPLGSLRWTAIVSALLFAVAVVATMRQRPRVGRPGLASSA